MCNKLSIERWIYEKKSINVLINSRRNLFDLLLQLVESRGRCRWFSRLIYLTCNIYWMDMNPNSFILSSESINNRPRRTICRALCNQFQLLLLNYFEINSQLNESIANSSRELTRCQGCCFKCFTGDDLLKQHLCKYNIKTPFLVGD